MIKRVELGTWDFDEKSPSKPRRNQFRHHQRYHTYIYMSIFQLQIVLLSLKWVSSLCQSWLWKNWIKPQKKILLLISFFLKKKSLEESENGWPINRYYKAVFVCAYLTVSLLSLSFLWLLFSPFIWYVILRVWPRLAC